MWKNPWSPEDGYDFSDPLTFTVRERLGDTQSSHLVTVGFWYLWLYCAG